MLSIQPRCICVSIREQAHISCSMSQQIIRCQSTMWCWSKTIKCLIKILFTGEPQKFLLSSRGSQWLTSPSWRKLRSRLKCIKNKQLHKTKLSKKIIIRKNFFRGINPVYKSRAINADTVSSLIRWRESSEYLPDFPSPLFPIRSKGVGFSTREERKQRFFSSRLMALEVRYDAT